MRFMTSSASLRSALRAPLAVVLLTGATTLLMQGCEDETLSARAASQTTIQEVSAEFTKVMAKHLAQDSDGSIATLTALQTKIDGVRETSNEQKAAVGILSAQIAQATANLEYAQALAASRSLLHERLHAAAAADAAATLRTISEAHKDISLASDRSYLQEQKKAGETSLRTAQDSIQQLEGPMGELKSRIGERKTEIAALQAKVEELRRRAIEAGALPGFPLIEQAAEEKSKIRDVRASVSTDELELSRIEPDYTRANLAHEGAKSIVSAADAGMTDLENFAAILSSESAATGKVADEYRAMVETKLGEIEKQREDLAKTYASIEQHLTKAINGAGSASSGGRAVAEHGKTAKITAQATLAAVLAEQAANLSADMQLHAALAGADDLFGGSAKQQPAIDALAKQREELLVRAKETIVDAIGQIGEASESERIATKGLRNSLNAMLAQMEGKAAPVVGMPTAAAAPAGEAPAGDVYRSGAGYESPEDFEASMGGLANPRSSSKKFVGGLRATSEAGRAMADGLAGLVSAMDPVVEAAAEKWGDTATAALAAANPMASGRVTAGTKSETRAEYTMAGAMGRDQTMVLVKDGNAWFIDVDSMLPPGAPAEAATMMVGIFQGMASTMRSAAEAVAARIRSGAITSPEQLQQELTEAMTQGMMGGQGGQRGGTADQ